MTNPEVKTKSQNGYWRIVALVLLIFGICLIALVIIFAPGSSVSQNKQSQATLMTSAVTIRGTSIKVELAQTNAEREHGLSDRSSLPADQGMLFLFNDSDYLSFWMKDMNFPLDIIFIDNGTIVDMAENLPPPALNSLPITYKSREKANRVLEVNAGTAKALGWQVGDSAVLP